jgi:hypothetical protein
MQIQRLLPTLALSFMAVAGHAAATTIQTASYSAWTASLTGSPSESSMYFSSSSYNTASGWSTTIGSYGTFVTTGPDNGAYTLNETTYSNLSALVGPNDGAGNGILITAPTAGVTAGLLGIGITGSAAPVSITLSDGEMFTINPNVNGTSFFGYSSSAPITSVFVSTASGSAVVLDDLWAGVSNVPADTPSSPAAECATILFIAGGLVFVGAKRKIYSNVTAAQAQ